MAISKVNSPYTKIQDVPDVPTIGTATEGEESAEVAFTPATTGGRAYQYRALSSPGSIEAVGSSSPITVPGLTADTTYSFQVRAETNTGATNGYSSASNSIVPTSSGAYDLLETTILSSDTSSVSFTSLNSTYGSTYKHLQVRMTTRAARSDFQNAFIVYINGETGGVYSNHGLTGTGSSVSTLATTSSVLRVGSTAESTAAANNFSATVLDLLDPFDTSKNTTTISVSGFENPSESQIRLFSGGYFQTSAVDSLEFTDPGVNFVTGSRFSLYGLKETV